MTRSQQMARIRGKDTSPEWLLRRGLWAAGVRYRLHARLEGATPDLLVRGAPVVLFVDGCFWHGCPDHYVLPRTRRDFWQTRLFDNVTRDIAQTARLRTAGYRVLRFWEHELFESGDTVVSTVKAAIRGEGGPNERWVARRVDDFDVEQRLEQWHLVDLYDVERTVEHVRIRTTTKWRRPAVAKFARPG